MSIYKEDIKEAKERLKAWWNHENIDRPCISYCYPKLNQRIPDVDVVLEYFDPFHLAQFWDDIETALINFEAVSNIFHFGGEYIPCFIPNYGPGIMASVLGIEPKFQSRTVWFHRDIPVEELIPLLERVEINMNNPWYARLKRITEIAAARAKNNYCVAITDLGGILDILSSFLSPSQLILTMKRNPEIIDTCRAIILDKWMKVYHDLQKLIGNHSDGYNSWMNIWCPKPWYPIQCDFSAFLSPKWFKRFVLPDIISQSEQMDYVIYHLDGPDALIHLDELLNIPSITGIQWVPGAGNELKCSETWMPVYIKIQNAGKKIFIDGFELPERLVYFYNELDPKELFISIIFMDYFRAKFYLPKFVGGEGNEGDFKKFKVKHRKELKQKNNNF